MICLACAIGKKVKLLQNSFRLGVCEACKQNKIVGEVKK